MNVDLRDMIAASARSWIGTPYRHQATTKGAGCDCLGLVRGVWREVVGPEIEATPPYTPDWGERGRSEVLHQAAARHLNEVPGPGRSGDVVLFRMRDKGIAKHLGILTNEGTHFVHAYTGHGVIESAMTEAWRRRVVATFEFPFERI